MAISLLVPFEATNLLSDAIGFELKHRLRHELGLIYSIDTFFTQSTSV